MCIRSLRIQFPASWTAVLLVLAVVGPAPSFAEPPEFNHPNFEKLSGSPLYLNTQRLTDRNDGRTFDIWGIQDADCGDCGTLFLITWRWNDDVVPIGTPRCDTLFKVLEKSTDGLKDIKCVNTHPSTGQELTQFLRYSEKNGKYMAFWPDGSPAVTRRQPGSKK